MKKSVEYEFFYLDDDVNPYAYSGDKEILRLFKKTRKMNKFLTKKIVMTSNDLHTLSEDEPGGLLLNYKFKIGDHVIKIPITTNEKLNIEGYGNRASMVDIYMTATKIPSNIFTKEIQKVLRLLEYQWASNYDSKYVGYYSFTPDLFMIFLKYYGNLMNICEEGSDNNESVLILSN